MADIAAIVPSELDGSDETEHADGDEVDRDDEVEEPRHHEDEDARDERDQRSDGEVDVHVVFLSSHSIRACSTLAGCSIAATWPQSSITVRRAPGIPSASSFNISTGMIWSSRPAITAVGQPMSFRCGRLSMRPMIASCWRLKASLPTASAMPPMTPERAASCRCAGVISLGISVAMTAGKSRSA